MLQTEVTFPLQLH